MAGRDNRYSRIVSMLKVALPLAALALLSMLFMISRSVNPDDALPYAQVDIDELLRDPRLTAPSYSGMTEQGDEVEFSAATAHPGAGDGTGARAREPLLRLLSPKGAETRVTAREAHIDPASNSLVLSDDVVIDTSTGYRLESGALLANLDQTHLESPGPVRAIAPGTEITAETMTLSRTDTASPEVLVFKGGVKLLYQPATAP